LQRDPKSLLWDAREAAEVIGAVTAGKSFADFDGDIVLRSAVERQFEIIGEALAQLARIYAAIAQKVPDLRQIIALSQCPDPRLRHSRSSPRLAGDRGQPAAAARHAGRAPCRARVRPLQAACALLLR
jgi:hypothetical protein